MRIVAGFAYRYEPDWLVDDLLVNIGWVDEIVSVNTRGDMRPWIPKEERTFAVRDRARETGADWLFEIDVDERLEVGAEAILRDAAEAGPDWLKVRLREMWTPTAYRVDGLWGRKTRGRFHRIRHATGPKKARRLDLNLYHLGMVEPESRQTRRDTHARWNYWDGNSRSYDYMLNEHGLRLEEIPPGREFTPPYTRPYVRKTPEERDES